MNNDIIAAVATGTGGATAVIRVSGTGAVAAVDAIFRGRNSLTTAPGGRFFYGNIVEEGESTPPMEGECNGNARGGYRSPHEAAAGSVSGFAPNACNSPSAVIPRRVEGSLCESKAQTTCNSEQSEPMPSRAALQAQLAKCPKREGGDSNGNIESSVVIVDDVIVSIFRAPHSYTGEETVEISCHGSRYIRNRIMQLLATQGVRPAQAGEFTMRALLGGRMELAQAEAVADIIAAENRSAHRVAANQMRGAYSGELSRLREELVRTAALLELEFDFCEEDVEFADRSELRALVDEVRGRLKRLAGSFAVGNALKNGVPVAIVGQPNVGKSTLLNALLGDDRAMVSAIAGTTRDTLEECVDLGGIRFRFVDTAGVRHSADPLEQMGIERTHTALARAQVVLLVVECTDGSQCTAGNLEVAPATSEESGIFAQRHAELSEESPAVIIPSLPMDLLEQGSSSASKTHSPPPPLAVGDIHRTHGRGALPSSAGVLSDQIAALRESVNLRPDQKVCVVINKVDAAPCHIPAMQSPSEKTGTDVKSSVVAVESTTPVSASAMDMCADGIAVAGGSGVRCVSLALDTPTIPISALRGDGLEELRAWLISTVDEGAVDEIIVSNTRHFDALTHAATALDRVAEGLGIPIISGTSTLPDSTTTAKTQAVPSGTPIPNALPLDLVTQDLREALHYLGLLTGAITTDELLHTIFSKFCIGK